jgi:transmembrane sensor
MFSAMIDPFHPASDHALDQATRWRARLADAPDDAELRAAFEGWRAVSPDHAAAWREAEALWALAEMPAARVARRERKRRAMLPWGIAAAAGAAWLLAPGIVRLVENLRADAVSPIGARQQIALADGSQVVLNSDTAIQQSVSANGERSVRILRGEAFFTVRHDPSRPFRVHTGDSTVTVLGTRFDVAAPGVSAEGTQVTVEQGRVRLDGPAGPVFLTADEQGVSRPDDTLKQKAASADVTAWRRGHAIFYDAPLPTVIANLNRYRARPIILMTRELQAQRLTAAVRTDAPGEALSAITARLGARALTLPEGTVLLF